jgi:hypothetical protein
MTREATARRNLGEFCGEIATIADVVAALTAIRDAAAEDITRPAVDGISAFSRLYTIITQNVLETAAGERARSFEDPAFLTLLDLEFARRYLAAIKADADGTGAPKAWDVLFRRRRDRIHHVNFAAAGVNAHVNFDLTYALLETWKTYPPNAARRRDYDKVNDIFADEMNGLRDSFEAFLSGVDVDGSLPDRVGNRLSKVLVVWTRWLAWLVARWVWRHHGRPSFDRVYARTLRRQDRVAAVAGAAILRFRRMP